MNPYDEVVDRLLPIHMGERLSMVVQRMEFALKRAGITAGSDAMASWKGLGTLLRQVGSDFYPAAQIDPIARLLISAPPAKLELDRDTKDLFWQEQHPPRDATELMETARFVRNSYLHGEKNPDVYRDEQLIRAALRTIELAMFFAHRYQDGCPKLQRFVQALFQNPNTLPRRAPKPR